MTDIRVDPTLIPDDAVEVSGPNEKSTLAASIEFLLNSKDVLDRVALSMVNFDRYAAGIPPVTLAEFNDKLEDPEHYRQKAREMLKNVLDDPNA